MKEPTSRQCRLRGMAELKRWVEKASVTNPRSISSMSEAKEGLFSISDGDAYCWAEQGSSVMLKAVTKFGDPVELSAEEAKALAQALLAAARAVE